MEVDNTQIDILPTLLYETARDSLASLLGAFCFIAPAFRDLLSSGLTVAPQTDTASPAAKIFILALMSRSW